MLIFLFDLFLEAKAEILEKISLFFLEDLETTKGHFKINWPLEVVLEGAGDGDCCVGDSFASFASFFNNDNSVFMDFGSMTVPKSSIVSKFAELLEMET